MQSYRFVAWSLKGLAKGLMGDTIPDGSKNCYYVLTQLNKKGLTRVLRQGRQTPVLTLNPAFSFSGMGHIWKRVWGRKSRLAWGSVSIYEPQRRILPGIFFIYKRMGLGKLFG